MGQTQGTDNGQSLAAAMANHTDAVHAKEQRTTMLYGQQAPEPVDPISAALAAHGDAFKQKKNVSSGEFWGPGSGC